MTDEHILTLEHEREGICGISGRCNGGIRVDNHTEEQRHRNMQAVKNKDSDIEIRLRKELWRRGIRYRKNVKNVFGHPDICFIGKKVAVFCDSEFWHGYNWESSRNKIQTRREFWIPKIERNMARDREVNEYLQSRGWIVIRLWGNEIKKNVTGCADRVIKALGGSVDE